MSEENNKHNNPPLTKEEMEGFLESLTESDAGLQEERNKRKAIFKEAQQRGIPKKHLERLHKEMKEDTPAKRKAKAADREAFAALAAIVEHEPFADSPLDESA